MAALAQLPALPALGQLFHVFTHLKELVEDWSVKEKFSFNIADKDHEQVIYTCVVPECQWRIRANQTEESDVKITVLNSEHNCLPSLAIQPAGELATTLLPAANPTLRTSLLKDPFSILHSKEQSHFCQTGP